MVIKPRHKTLFFLLFFSLIIYNSWAGEEYWQQFVQYQINANLDPDNHLIKGFEILLYQNNSPDTLSKLYFHLYPNAFQQNSIMAKEARAADNNIIRSTENIGWIKIDSLSVSKTHSNQPINIAADIEDTILKIELSDHLFPGEQLSISMKFATKVRKFTPAGGKGGYKKNLYEVSQWYPKVCVYDQNGWNPIPYHWLGEFYGEFGTFDVTINVPDSFIVAATGEIVSGDPGWISVEIDSNGSFACQSNFSSHSANFDNNSSLRRIVTFHAENVHDFVWTASSEYLYQTSIWQNTPIRILFRKSSQKYWHNIALKNAKKGLKWLHNLVGQYPYPQLTICEGMLAGGMEYPMVTILGQTDLTLIVHEIAHNYFYAAVANNEQNEGWLDEGLVTYISEFLVEENEPDQISKITPSIPIKSNFLRKQFGLYELNDIRLNSLYYYFYSGFEKPISTKCYELKNIYLYFYNVYLKPSKFFAMLDYLVGRETFQNILQAYYEQWKFKHVNGEIFKMVCEQVSGVDLDWFFDQWIDGNARIDYACTDFTVQKLKHGEWKTNINVKQLGDGIMPFETEIVTETGDTIRKRYHGIEGVTTLSFLTNSKVKNFQIDPDDIILDQNRLNNGIPRVRHFYYPDFVSMYYLPRDAYSLFWWPQMWYNDRDGLKTGIKFHGGYLNRYYVIRSNLWYGFKSNQIDFDFGYSMPWETVNKNLWRHIYVARIEGRTEIDISLNYILYKEFSNYKCHEFVIGFLHQHVYGDQYSFRRINSGCETIEVRTWDRGNVNKFHLSFQTDCLRWLPKGKFVFKSKLSNKAWGSDFNFVKLSLKSQFTLGSIRRNWKVNIRNFIGYCNQDKDQLPIQDIFWIAEGNPSQQFKYFYLRSIGSTPAWINYHYPGDCNLRGYLNKLIQRNSPLTTNKLITANVDFVHRKIHYLLPKKIRGFITGIDFMLFLDAGRIWNDDLDKKYLFDAGFGLRFYKMILGKQRKLGLDFPLWLSHPKLDQSSPFEPHWKFRWIVSFQ